MIHFYKYQGTGNDFVLIDNRTKSVQLNKEQIALLCHRRFGIGADGLMLLESADNFDFKMVYYNADGNESTMCGNGGRCITAFAKKLGIIAHSAIFTAIDGVHKANFTEENTIALQMNDVDNIQHFGTYSILNTGSPHYVLWSKNIAAINVVHEGRMIRNQKEFSPNGINVNFAEKNDVLLNVRTYERGVEDETLSCGTGVTACAIAASQNELGEFEKNINTPGGKLKVAFIKNTASTAIEVVLTGAANFVFEGTIDI